MLINQRMLKGVFEVIPSHLLRVFDPSQLELLMCGLQVDIFDQYQITTVFIKVIDVSDWRAHTLYKGGYNPNHIVSKYLQLYCFYPFQYISFRSFITFGNLFSLYPMKCVQSWCSL